MRGQPTGGLAHGGVSCRLVADRGVTRKGGVSFSGVWLITGGGVPVPSTDPGGVSVL